MKFFLSIIIPFVLLSHLSAQGFDDVQIKTIKVSENIFMLEGAGGNVGIFKGDEGLIMIDNQFADLSVKLKSAIKLISDQPIKYLINTHWHGDLTGGNANFNEGNTLVVAHENVRQRLSTDQFMKAFQRSVDAKPKIYWPEITYDEDVKLHLNNESVHVFHVHNAHTDGDSFVLFPGENVLHMGDCFFNKRFPFIDLGSGGSIEGAIKAVQAAVMIADDDTKIIPGHGVLASKADLVEYLDVITMMTDQVKDGIKRGVSLETMKTAGFDKDYESWGTGFISTEKFIDTIWTDLNREEE